MEQITDQQLFDELDLDRKDLQPVKTALEAGDPGTARTELWKHFSSRTYPIPPPLGEKRDQRGHGEEAGLALVEEADRIVDHIFQFVGHPPQQLEPEIAWNEDPVSYDQWPISFNRHFHWITLAQAYAQTGNEKYATEFVAQLKSWIHAMPVEIGKTWVQGGWATEGRMSLSLDAGIRMGQTWVPAFYAFLGTPQFDVDAGLAMVKAFRDHALYLMDPVHFKSLSNWGVMESNGLYHIGAYFPEFAASAVWRDTAMQRLRQEIDLQMYPDGAQVELASGYHYVSVRNFVMAYEAALLNDLPVPDDYLASLERAYDYSLRVAFPDLRMPAVNDSGPYDIRRAMREAQGFFPRRTDFEWAATEGESGSPPEDESSASPYAGHFMMRSGWQKDNSAMFFDGGPFGYGHQHEDKLNIILYAHGSILIADPGNYQYDPSEWRRYMLSSWSHNTVTVDGMGQRQQGKPRVEYIVKEPLPHTWISKPGYDFVSAEYDEGYGDDRDSTVTHRRSILYVKPDLWIIADILTASDDREHTYESAFHFTADAAHAEGLNASTLNDAAPGCMVQALGPEGTTLRIASGEREPRLRGWMPRDGDISCCHPAPTAVYSFSGTGKIIMTYVISAAAKGEPSAVSSLQRVRTGPADLTAIGGTIKKADGRTIHFCMREPGQHRVHILDGETDAEAGAMVLGRDGRIEALHLANGTGVWGEGQPLTVGDYI